MPRNINEAKTMIASFQEEFKRLDTNYRARVDRLDAELCITKDKIVKLVDERTDLDDELEETRAKLKEVKALVAERDITVN